MLCGCGRRYLYLHNNQLTGTIPESLDSLTYLKRVVVRSFDAADMLNSTLHATWM
jgi:hypothetical protein